MLNTPAASSKHAQWYDALVFILIDKTLYRVSKRLLDGESTYFRTMLNDAPTADGPFRGTTEESPIELEGFTVFEMETFLSALYASPFSDDLERLDVQEWEAILRLSTEWSCERIRLHAVNVLQDNRARPQPSSSHQPLPTPTQDVQGAGPVPAPYAEPQTAGVEAGSGEEETPAAIAAPAPRPGRGRRGAGRPKKAETLKPIAVAPIVVTEEEYTAQLDAHPVQRKRTAAEKEKAREVAKTKAWLNEKAQVKAREATVAKAKAKAKAQAQRAKVARMLKERERGKGEAECAKKNLVTVHQRLRG